MAVARRVFLPHTQSFSWSAKDLNDDDLVYSVYYRGQDESNWKLLEEGIAETHYTIDAVSFPDGVYFAKVVVSDLRSNPAHQALESQLISKAFVITNSSPGVELGPAQVQNQQVSVKFTAQTSASIVYQAEYSVDAEQWNVLFPKDGMADQLSGAIRFYSEGPDAGRALHLHPRGGLGRKHWNGKDDDFDRMSRKTSKRTRK